MKMNIVNAKKLIDVRQININDTIYIEIVKNMSQAANNVNYMLSIEKKNAAFYLNFRMVLKD